MLKTSKHLDQILKALQCIKELGVGNLAFCYLLLHFLNFCEGRKSSSWYFCGSTVATDPSSAVAHHPFSKKKKNCIPQAGLNEPLVAHRAFQPTFTQWASAEPGDLWLYFSWPLMVQKVKENTEVTSCESVRHILHKNNCDIFTLGLLYSSENKFVL